MAQPALASEHLDPTLVARARRFEREAVAKLCDRNLPALYRMCEGLTGKAELAEQIAGGALLKALDGLESFAGDSRAFDVWLLRLAASGAARSRAQANGLAPEARPRSSLARLSSFDYELVALRILGGVDSDHLAPALNAPPANLRAWLVSALRIVDGRGGSGWGHDLRGFDAAIDEVIRGREPQHAAATVPAPHDAAALLKAALRIRSLSDGQLPADAATRLRTNLLAATAERRAHWVYRHHGAATVPGVQRRRYSSRTGTVAALALAAVLAVVVGAVGAGLSMFAGPESLLYPLKRAGESTLVAINVDSVDRAQLQVKLAQTREREAEDMASRGEGSRTVMALSDRYALLRAAGRDLASVPPTRRDKRWQTARERYFKEADKLVGQIGRDLLATNQRPEAEEVQQLVSRFEAERRPVEAELGRQASEPGQNPPPPSSQPR